MVMQKGKKGIKVGKKKRPVRVQEQLVSTRAASRGNGKANVLATLDQAGKDYARLLADPCAARLVPSVFPGAGGAVIGRFESDVSVFTTAAENAGMFVWCPAIASQSTNSVALATDTLGTSLAFVGPAAGNAFLNSNAQSYRCISACMQVYYLGTELNRSGFVSIGYGNGGILSTYSPVANGGSGSTLNVSQLRQSHFHTERTPSTMMELKFKPSQGDADWTSPYTVAQLQANYSDVLADKSVIGFTCAGIPASTGFRVRLVAVYEYMPNPGSGLIASSGNAPPSRNTQNEVLHALEKTGNWFLDAATTYGPPALSAISYAATMFA